MLIIEPIIVTRERTLLLARPSHGPKPMASNTGYCGWQSYQNHSRIESGGEFLLPEEKQKDAEKPKQMFGVFTVSLSQQCCIPGKELKF